MNRQQLLSELENVNIFTNSGCINKQAQRLLNKFPVLLQQLLHHTSFLELDTSCRARLYALKNGITVLPTCKTCGAVMTFNNAKGSFNNYCQNTKQSSCSSKDINIVQNQRNTMIERYGVSNAAHSVVLQDKKCNTMIERYGVASPTLSKEIKEKIKNTLNDRYGVSNISDIPGILKKRQDTNLIRYGANTFAQSLINKESRELLLDVDWVKDQLKDFTLSEMALALEVSTYTIRKCVYQLNLQHLIINTGSSEQRDISKFLDSLDVEYTSNDKQMISPKELDFYIPSKNLALEYDGIFFHSELSNKSRRYHIDKTISCKNAGVRLIHIWSSDWTTKKEIVLSRLRYALGKCTQIAARKCQLSVMSSLDEKLFFDEHHIQGYTRSNICYSLMVGDVVVAAMSFIKPRFSNKYEWELLRYSSIKNHNVVGGASKLFQHFIKQHNPTSIISYCDLRWGTGKVYTQLGFTYSHTSSPNYFYFNRNGDTNKLYTRIPFQKHKLPKILPKFDQDLTEWENMKSNGYDRIWDCGNNVYIWSIS